MTTRRQFTGAIGATTTVALAGCSGILGPSNNPEYPMIAVVEAADAGNEDGVAEATHSQYPGDGFNQLGEFRRHHNRTDVRGEGAGRDRRRRVQDSRVSSRV